MRASTVGTFTKLLVVIAVVTLLAGIASAQVTGALQTTTSTGTVVDGNIYNAKTDVYINGGPQNENDPGLNPPGNYYFMVTDPDGKKLLSSDDISCREVVVSGGRITAVTGPCPHLPGTLDAANGELPVQLFPFDDTPNSGGEYKAWITPVADYSLANCSTGKDAFGFCTSSSKTDNFKVLPSAIITVCKFNDNGGVNSDGVAQDGIQNGSEALLPHWLISAATSWGTSRTRQTRDDGCIGFSLTPPKGATFPVTVTLTETLQSGWTQSAPIDATQPRPAQCTTPSFDDVCTLNAGDIVTAPYFGNFQSGAAQQPLIVSKTAIPSYTDTYAWTITKGASGTSVLNGTQTVFSAGGGTSGLAGYTVTVTHDNGTISNIAVTGLITVSNNNGTDVTNASVTDLVDNGGSCTVKTSLGGQDPTNATIGSNSHEDFPYTCTYTGSTLPDFGTNTATATWPDGQSIGTATVDFTDPSTVITLADNSVTVTDTYGGTLGTATVDAGGTMTVTGGVVDGTNPNQADFTYTHSFTGDPAGTCTSHQNTATFTTNTSGTQNTAQATVQDCQGADLQVSKTATAAFNSSIAKKVNQTKVEQSGGNITFNYTVTVTESTWTVTGDIYVYNPNDWESITPTSVTDTIDGGGSCTISGTVAAIGPKGTLDLPYTCSYSSKPTLVSGTNTATAYWNSSTAYTPDGSATGTKGYTFNTLTITDTVNSSSYTNCNATLGTVSVTTTTPSTTPGCGLLSLTSPSWGVFTYSITDANSSAGTCSSYDNTATITGGSPSNKVTVTVCNTGTGALTMGFWKNTNGQGIIKAYCGGTSGTSLQAFLTSYNPFKDDTTAGCSAQASYVSSVITKATCTSTTNTCNTMLRAQMLATALDVYFSTPSLGGNKIGAYNGLGTKTPALGTVAVDLSHICNMIDGTSGSSCSGAYEDSRPEFGIAPPCLGTTVGQMLSYSNFPSGVNGNPVATATTGASWYLQNKTKQVFAKDGFDNFNNQIANIAPTSCSSTF